MTPLGKPLVSYLKYMAEMNLLCGEVESAGGKPDLTGLDDAEHVHEMARTVGAAASEQAADLLERCGEAIADHFTRLRIATLGRRTRRALVVRDWNWGVDVHVSPGSRGWFSCGAWLTAPPEVRISLPKDVCGVIVPWLWSKGSRKGEDAVWKTLGGWPHSRTGEGLVHKSGTVALACIPIKVQPPESFDVAREQLVTDTMESVARIGAAETRAIASFVAGLKRSD